jgi:nucleoside-diphosphate-sugar epimerase
MKVFVTGGTGFIGSNLTLKFIDRGDSVRVLGQENTAAEVENRRVIEEKGAEVIIASVTDRETLFDLLKGIDVVYHLAAAQHEMNISDQRFWDVNVMGTKNVLEASIESGVRRFVHGSTIGVYGRLEGPIDEQSLCEPDNIYGKTKLEGEMLALSYQQNLPVVVIRISETFGPGDRRLLKLFKAINRRLFFMIGNGENMHHPIYVDDLIEGFSLAATVEEAVGQVFILAGKDSVTTSDMVSMIAGVLDTSVPKFNIPLNPMLKFAKVTERFLRPIGISPPIHLRRMDFFTKSFAFSQDKAFKVLGFVPRVDFRQGLLETFNWYKNMDYI